NIMDRANLFENQAGEDLSVSERIDRGTSDLLNNIVDSAFSGKKGQLSSTLAKGMQDITQSTVNGARNLLDKINKSTGNITGHIHHLMTGAPYEYTNDEGETVRVEKNEKGGAVGLIKDKLLGGLEKGKDLGKKIWSGIQKTFDFGSGYDDKEEDPRTQGEKKRAITGGALAGAGLGILGGPIGMLAGSIAGAGIGSSKKITDTLMSKLFGRYQEDDGKHKKGDAKGIFTKLGDTIFDPIKFQINKTATIIGHNIKTKIADKIQDFGTALKDRITSHVDRGFTRFMKKVGGILFKPFELLGKGIGKVFKGIGTGLFNLGARTGPGMAGFFARRAVNGVLNPISGVLGGSAALLRINTFHILKNGEKHWLVVGDEYFNPAEAEKLKEGLDAKQKKNFDNRRAVHKLKNPINQDLVDYYPNESFKIEEIKDTESKIDGKDGVLLIGNGSKNYPRPTANDFHAQLKSQRKLENQKFKEALKSKSFKTWRMEHHLEKMSEAEAAKQYMAEKEAKEKKETEEQKEKTENKQTINNIDTNVKDIADGIKDIAGATGNIDQRDAEIIAQQKEEAEKKEAGDTTQTAAEKRDQDAEAAQQQVDTIATLANDEVDSQNKEALKNAVANAASDKPDPKKNQGEVNKVIDNEADKNKEEERPEKNRKTIFEKMGDMFSNMGGLSGIGNLLGGGLTSLLPGIIVGGLAIGFLTKFLGDPSGTVSGVFNNIKGAFSNLMGFIKDGEGSPLNAVTSLFDMQVDNTAEFGLPVGTIDHVTTDAAGNKITNQAATQARNTFSQHAITDYFTRNQLARNSIWKDRVANARQWKYQGWSFNDKYVDQALRMNPEMTSQEFGQMLANNGVPYDEIAASTQKFNQAKDTLNTNRYIGSDDIAEYNAANPDKNKGGGFNSNTAVKMAAATGVTAAVSGGAGFLTSSIAKGFGASDETAGMVNRGTQVLTSGAMMQNMAKNMMKDPVKGMDNSWVGKIVNGLEKLVNGIKEKAIQKWPQMAEKVGGGFNKIQGFVKGINAKVLEPFKKKISDALVKAGVKGGLGAISGGVMVAAGAVMGIINGIVSTEHLFGVLPGDATPQMRTISALLGSAMGALSAVPAISFVVACIDVIDMVFKTIAGKGLMQMIAEAMMNATPEGAQELAEAQGRMQAEVDAYNEKFGTSMDANTYNDMVNNADLGQAMWEGNIKKNEDGSIYYDEAGAVVRTGMKNMFVGSEKLYAHDANGNLIRDAEGNAIQAMDAYGNTLLADENWGNHVGKFFHNMGTKLFGGDVYETDENGQAIIDPETGQPVKKGQEMGFFESLGRGLFGGDAYERNEDGSIKVDPVTGERIVKEDTRELNGFERIGTNISSVWTGLFGSKEEKEALAEKMKNGTLYERTKEEDEANREKVMRVMDPKYAEKEWGPEGEESKAGKSGDVKNKAITGSEVTTDEEGNTIRTETKADGSKVVTTTRKDGSSYTTYYKPNGEIELKIGSGDKEKNMGEIVTGSIGGVFGSVIKNVRDITDGVEKWNKEKAPWGTEDPAKYMSDEVQGFYDGVLGPVNDLIKNTAAKMGKLLNVNVTSNTSSGDYTYDVNSETGFSDTEGYSYNGSDSVTDTFVDQYGLERRLPSGYSEKNGVVYDSRGNKINTDTFEIVNLPSEYSQKNGNIYDSRGNKVNPEALGGKLQLPSGYSEKNGKVYDRQGHEVDRNAFRVSNTALTSTGSVKYSAPIGPQPQGSPGEWGIGGDESMANAMSQFSNIGKSFLNEISGGLFGNGDSSDDITITTNGGSGTVNGSSGTGITDEISANVSNGQLVDKTGQDIQVPAGLGTSNPYMHWQKITAASLQKDLKDATGMKFDSNGYGIIDGRYVVAMTSTYGQVGDYVDVYRDGSTLKAIIGDIKNPNDPGCNKWGHDNGNSVIEFIVSKDVVKNQSQIYGTDPGKNRGAVKHVTNQGNWFLKNGAGSPDDIPDGLGAPSPLSNATISSPFGERPELGDYHKGLDLIPGGNDRVQSTVNGKVVSVKKGVSDSDTGIDYKGKNPSGNEVIIQGEDGLLYRNSHMKASSIPADMAPGKTVKRGDKLGLVGSTGRSSGKHLHYEVAKLDGKGNPISINPLALGKGSQSSKNQTRKYGVGFPALLRNIRKGIGAAGEMTGSTSSDFNRWVEICQQVKLQYSKNTYDKDSGRTIPISYGNKKINRRPDCSGYVSACITFFSGKDYNNNSSGMMSDGNASAYGFTKSKFPGWNNLWEGDILIKDGHVEVYYGSVNGSHKSWSVGPNGIKDPGPGPANTSMSWSYIWRPNCSTGQRVDVSNITASNGTGELIGDGTTVEAEQETGLAGVLGQLKQVGATFLNEISGGLFGSVDGSSSTTTDVSGVGSNIASGTGDFKKYSLTDSEITGLANIVGHEQGNRAGKYAEASLIANQADMHNQTPVQRATSSWFADGANRMKGSEKADADAIAAVKDVIIGGKRTLPGYIDEHDCWS
ncbi:MAG: peptidoglycan DD-metalloendopeptidase family protein, partial [Clostridia bacterium]|nr:peptidoglycan DD-metalloendopeptidase family protein [Clostridia bacterium]